MKLTIHLVHETNPQLQQQLDSIYSAIERFDERGARIMDQLSVVHFRLERIMATLDEVLTAVNDESTQEDSIVALLGQLREQIIGLTSGNLPPDVQAKVDAVFTGLQANKKKLADAIANPGSNPPAPAPAPTPDPVPTPAV